MHLTLDGLWTRATLARFTAELLARTSMARLRHGTFAILSDSTRFAVQTPEVAEGFTRIMAHGTKTHKGPTAIVVGSMLSKLQAERLMASPRTAVFLEFDRARAWLADQGY